MIPIPFIKTFEHMIAKVQFTQFYIINLNCFLHLDFDRAAEVFHGSGAERL